MRFPFCPPLAFWRDWLSVSGQVFARTVAALFVVGSLCWPLLVLLAPPHPHPYPRLLAQAGADLDDPWACTCYGCPGGDE
jgi:hypothetical protein